MGFFYVIGHSVERRVSEGVLSAARTWFTTATPAEKAAIALGPHTHHRGYQALGANVTRHEGGFTRDQNEALDFYSEFGDQRNPWPAGPAGGGFTAAAGAWNAAALRLGAALLRGLAIGLKLPGEDFFLQPGRAADPFWVLRVIHYPPLASPPPHRGELDRSTPLSCGEHTDYGLLTIVNQEPTVSALQVKNAEGRWVDAPPLSGAFCCNIGDMFRVWTNGLLMPTLHRVVNAEPGVSRVSTPFFFETELDALIAPLPQFGPPRFEPVRYSDHLKAKISQNFEL